MRTRIVKSQLKKHKKLARLCGRDFDSFADAILFALSARLPRETTLRGPGLNGAIGEAALHEWAALFMEGREEHKCKHKNPVGAYILCGLTTARKDIGAAHKGPWG